METILRKTIKSGNASAVVLPKSWLNKSVKIDLVEKTNETILYDVLQIVKSEIDTSEIIGVYLVGSYAREEQTASSDVDILIVTEKTSKNIKREDYEIMIISLDLLKYKVEESLLPVGAMLKEAVPLLNSSLLRNISIKATKKNTSWFLESTKNSLDIVKESIDRIERKKPDGLLSDAVAYSLVLRLRTLYTIDCLINNKKYRKEELVSLIKRISGSLIAYDRYSYAKNHEESKRELPLSEGKRLCIYVKDYLERVKASVK